MAPPSHLVVVCCHAVWLGGPTKGADEAEWLLAAFQRGETSTFVQHAEAGVRALAADDAAVLVFSGGPTRRETERSEARSYDDLAAQNDYWGLLPAARRAAATAVLLEERALDSYHNVLFSLTRFRARFRAWPAAVTLVGHAFKRPRLEAHCRAIGYPPDGGRVAYVGIDPPAAAQAAARGITRAVDEWAADPHGRGQVLAGKRRARNPWRVWQGVFEPSCRDRGGLVTKGGEGEEETLDEDAPRPWL